MSHSKSIPELELDAELVKHLQSNSTAMKQIRKAAKKSLDAAAERISLLAAFGVRCSVEHKLDLEKLTYEVRVKPDAKDVAEYKKKMGIK